jgi:hypothetical protein
VKTLQKSKKEDITMYPDSNDAFLLILYLLYYLFAMAYGAFSYIGMGLGGFRMARKIGMTAPWMFWIPMANAYAMGNLADQQASLCDGRSTTYRKKMLTWNIVIICAALLLVIAFAVFMIAAAANGMLDANGDLVTLDGFDPDALIGPALFFLATFLVFLVLYIICLVVYYKVLYRIFKLYAPDGAVGLLILSIFVNVAIPAVFLILSGKEPALPMPAEGEGEYDGENGYYSL